MLVRSAALAAVLSLPLLQGAPGARVGEMRPAVTAAPRPAPLAAAGAPTAAPAGEAAAPRSAPEWRNKSWLNTDHALTLSELRGKVVLLNFWVFTCINCQRTIPSLVKLDREFRDKGLVTIGIHTPEFPPYAGEHDKNNVAKALKREGITYPNAQDNDNATWDLYGIRYWPSIVLIDKKGQVRYETYGEIHVGEGTHATLQRHIEELLAE